MTIHFHPHTGEHGQPVPIKHPSTPTAPATWDDPDAVAIFVPGGDAPSMLCGVPMAPWRPPAGPGAWAGTIAMPEPPFACPAGLKPAAGVVIAEPDGRIWLAQPTNGFGGVSHVIPKGKIDLGSTPAETAIREAFEETGLRVELTGHLVDVKRSTSYTRYYLGRRIAGTPVDAGWETQGVALSPKAILPKLLNGPHDGPLVKAILGA